MSITGLFGQTGTIQNPATNSGDGRLTYGSSTSVKCRLQPKTVRRLLPNGNIKEINAIAYVPAATTVQDNAKFTHGSDVYKVVGVYPVPDGRGSTHHKKLELQVWR